ncbi:MAG: MmgE/PrpD family protein [Alphaproteobacteria bacterium]|nr:MmgE/PrpD family protein [Alphaproteobacteria bacterium]
MGATITERLTDLLGRKIDPETRQRACLHLLDWLSCATLGATAPAGQALLAYARASEGGQTCATIGAGRRAVETAAFVNGGLGNIFEMDDLHRTSIVHPGDVVIPAALAVAERDGASGIAVLDAIARGYEAAIRIGAAAGTRHYAYWYNTATCGVFGAAAAAGSILGLNKPKMVDALGQAGMQASGLWQCRLEPTRSKQLATARAAQSGVIAADLAAIGFPGPRQILEGPLGFFAATCPDGEPEAVITLPHEPWRIHDVSFKPWPACRHAHPVIEAALALRARAASALPREIEVLTYAEAVGFCDNPDPTTPHAARFSLQHCAALALLKGAPQLEDFKQQAIAEPSVVALRSKVGVRADRQMTEAFPTRYGASVSILHDDGSRDEELVETAKGDPENPMDEGEILDKSRTLLAAAGIADDAIGDLQDAALNLPFAESVTGLSELLVRLEPRASDLS